MNRIPFLILMLLMAASCSSTRKIQAPPPSPNANDTNMIIGHVNEHDTAAYIHQVYENISKQRISFHSFSAKLAVDYTNENEAFTNMNVFLRMKKDTAIWISVNAIFGIEAFRMLVTPDSVKLLDKQNKIYTVRPVSYLQDITGLPLNFFTLQDLLIGNAIFLDPNITAYSKAGNEIALLGFGPYFKNLSVFNLGEFKILRSRLDDRNASPGRYADLIYDNYVLQEKINFARKRSITITDTKKINIEMEFKQLDFKEELTFPFSIPKNYSAN